MNRHVKATIGIVFCAAHSAALLSDEPVPDSRALATDKGPAAVTPKAFPNAFPSEQPLALDDLIALALENNPDMRIATERIGEAKARLGGAMSAFYPRLKTRIAYDYTDNPALAFSMIVSQRQFTPDSNINHPGGTTNFRPEIVGTYSLYRGGQDYQRGKAAELGVEVSTLERGSIRNQLIQMVSSTYYGYLAAQAALAVAERSIEAVRSQLKQTRTRYETGTTLKADVLSIEVQLAQVRDARIQASNAVDLAHTAIKRLLGLPADQPLAVARLTNPPIPRSPATLDASLVQALEQRPEVEAAARQIEMRVSELKMARGAHLPKADAFVSYGQDSRSPGFSTAKDNLSAGVAVELELFSGFKTSQRVAAAERKLAQAREAERRVSLNVESEVKAAYLTLQEALERIEVTKASVHQAAEEALRLVTLQWQAGTVTVTRYIDANVDRDQAHSLAIAARYDALRAEAVLKKATGIWR
jgi:outer membrane protein